MPLKYENVMYCEEKSLKPFFFLRVTKFQIIKKCLIYVWKYDLWSSREVGRCKWWQKMTKFTWQSLKFLKVEKIVGSNLKKELFLTLWQITILILWDLLALKRKTFLQDLQFANLSAIFFCAGSKKMDCSSYLSNTKMYLSTQALRCISYKTRLRMVQNFSVCDDGINFAATVIFSCLS